MQKPGVASRWDTTLRYDLKQELTRPRHQGTTKCRVPDSRAQSCEADRREPWQAAQIASPAGPDGPVLADLSLGSSPTWYDSH